MKLLRKMFSKKDNNSGDSGIKNIAGGVGLAVGSSPVRTAQYYKKKFIQ